MNPEERLSDEQRAWAQADARNRELGKQKMTVRGPKYFAVAVQDKDGNWTVEDQKDESKAGWLKSIFSSIFQAP